MKNPYDAFDEYGLRYLLTHLIEAEAWEGMEQIFSDVLFVETKCSAEMRYELIVDYTDAILRSPDAFSLLENIWKGLAPRRSELLQQLLHRFLYVASVPDQRVLKFLPKDREFENSSHVRHPRPVYWPPMLKFLAHHRYEVIECAPNQVAKIVKQWLGQNQDHSYQKEAAELGLAIAWRIFHRDHCYNWYRQRNVRPKIAYQAVLASVAVLPKQAIEFILIACGRQEPPPPPPELIEPAEPVSARNPNLPTPPLGSFYPEVEIPAWPDGSKWPIDRHFREICLTESQHLVLLMAGYPEIARELILALLIREPGKRPEDWQSNEFYCDYELQDQHGWFPPFYNEGPFLTFLLLKPRIGLDLILRLVNFATEQWKARREAQNQAPPAVIIPFPNGEQRWLGDRRMYAAYRDSTIFPDVIVCALMALEKWCYDNLENQDALTEAINRILTQTQSLAFAGFLIGIGKKHPALFKNSLGPFLAVPEFYQWETMHQCDGEGHQVSGWDRLRHSEQQIEQAREWHNMPHRKQELSEVALHVFLNDEIIRKFIENAREQWQTRLQQSKLDDPLYDRLTKLSREFDIENWERGEHPEYGKFWRFQAPKDFLEQLVKERPQFLKQQTLFLFPSQCRQRLSENKALEEDELEEFWESLQRLERFTDEELENFSRQLHDRRESGLELDDPDAGIRQLRNSLCAGVTVLIHLHREWLREHPEKEEWCVRTLVDTILSPPSPSPLDNEVSVFDMNWDNFCAYAIPILWVEEPESELWRRLIVRLVTHAHYLTPQILFLQTVKYRRQLGDDFLRLQHLILRWAWARWHFRHPVPMEKKRGRKKRHVKVSKKFDAVVQKFIKGSLATKLPSWVMLATAERSLSMPFSKKLHFQQDPGIDLTLIRHAFDAMPALEKAQGSSERFRIITFWKEALQCVLRLLGNGDDEIEEFDHTPGDFESWVFDKIAQLLLQFQATENPQDFWMPIFNLGVPAHDWIGFFLRDWIYYGLTFTQHKGKFIEVWKAMLDFAFSSPKWDNKLKKGNHYLDELWYLLMGLGGNYLNLWNEEKATLVTEMRDYYERWAPLHLFQGHRTSTFIAFLQNPAAKDICLDGLLWLERAANETESDFKYEQGSLVELLTFYWQEHQSALRQHPGYWSAFDNILNRLVRQGNTQALALSERVATEASK